LLCVFWRFLPGQSGLIQTATPPPTARTARWSAR